MFVCIADPFFPSSEVSEDLIPSFPSSLQRFYIPQWRALAPQMDLHLKEACDESTEALARLCAGLTEFVAPSHLNMTRFFQFFDASIMNEKGEEPVRCENLQRVSFCTNCFEIDTTQKVFEDMLCLAARAALSFPSLQVIEIWRAGPGATGGRMDIFRYTLEHEQATITWRSSRPYKFKLAPRILEEWAKVASEYSHRPLRVDVVPFTETPAEIDGSLGSCIYRHLALRKLAVDPVTQAQLEFLRRP